MWLLAIQYVRLIESEDVDGKAGENKSSRKGRLQLMTVGGNVNSRDITRSCVASVEQCESTLKAPASRSLVVDYFFFSL